MDERYICYGLIDLMDLAGDPMKKDRNYCELKNPDQYLIKYTCIEELKCLETNDPSLSAFTSCMASFETSKESFCQVTLGHTPDSPEDTKCQTDIKAPIRLSPIEKGADYCYLSYFWDDQYELLYACLEAQGLQKDSTYCRLQYKYFKGLKEKEVQKRREDEGDAFVEDPVADVYGVEKLYECQKGMGIPDSSEEGFDSTKCENLVAINKANSYEQKRITDFTVYKNKEVITPIKIVNRVCHQARGTKDSQAWIKTSFSSEEEVYSIEIFNPVIKGSSSLL